MITILAALNENNAISYETVKRRLTEKYSGEEYKRHLESKRRNLKFRAITKIPEFLHDLRSTIRDYYSLTNVEQIDQIGMNHILSTLEDSVREDAKILQLSGNVKIENLLELITTKLSKGFSLVQPIAAAAYTVQNNDQCVYPNGQWFFFIRKYKILQLCPNGHSFFTAKCKILKTVPKGSFVFSQRNTKF